MRWALLPILASLTVACANADRERLLSYRAATIRPVATSTVGVPALKVRILVEESYQHTYLGWQLRVYRLIQRASLVWVARYGVALEPVEIRGWSSPSANSSLSLALDALEAEGSADDVDLVVGMVGPLSIFTASMHHLGIARVLGKHLVLRGLDDPAEVDAFRGAFGRLSDEERERVYLQRLQHKELAVLLHELGHAFGALHISDPKSLMMTHWDAQMAHFDPSSDALIRASLEHRGAAQAQRQALLKVLDEDRANRWWSKDKAHLRSILGAGQPASDRAFAPDDMVPEPEMGPVERAQRPRSVALGQPPLESEVLRITEQIRSGEVEAAWTYARSLLQQHSDNPRLLRLACSVGVTRSATAAESRDVCQRARTAAPQAPDVLLNLALTFPVDGTQPLGAIEADLAKSPETKPEHWGLLAQIYQRHVFVTHAERAAKLATETEAGASVLGWAAELRARFGLPADTVQLGLAPDDEPRYFALRRNLWDDMGQTRYTQVVAAAEKIIAEYPLLPGPTAEICEALVRLSRFAAAEPRCVQASQDRQKDAGPRLYLGFLRLAQRRAQAAVSPLEDARQLAPQKKEIWQYLYAAYRSAGKRQQAKSLADEYRATFGMTLR